MDNWEEANSPQIALDVVDSDVRVGLLQPSLARAMRMVVGCSVGATQIAIIECYSRRDLQVQI